MKPVRAYASAAAFRRALEDRLARLAAQESTDLSRLQKRVAFERLLVRMFSGDGEAQPPPWLLKGGYALEMRLKHTARATKDIDLTVPEGVALGLEPTAAENVSERLLDLLREAVEEDRAGDGFEFRVGAPMQDLAMAPLAGARYPVECVLAGRTFTRFHLDVGVGDAVAQPADIIEGHALLSFAGIVPLRAAVVPLTVHFAEKLHAYTRTRMGTPNSRVRDLTDMVLLIQLGLQPDEALQAAVAATFARRATHPVPGIVPPPPPEWSPTYAQIAADIRLGIDDATAAHRLIAEFWERAGRSGE